MTERGGPGQPDGGPGQPGGGPGQPDGGPELCNNTSSLSLQDFIGTPPLSGFIGYEYKQDAVYARYMKSTFTRNGKTYHDSRYLGRVVDKERGIFRNRSLGTFSFDLENGIRNVSILVNDSLMEDTRAHISLEFGDIWLIDQILKETGLDTVIERLIPKRSDTLKALVGYKLLSNDVYVYANAWYRSSYARVLYPGANVDSPWISEFHAELGTEENLNKFFELYLETVFRIKELNEQMSFVVAMDSAGVANDIKTFLTAMNNHNGVVSKEIRITYLLDLKTKIPLLFRITPGNIIDNSTLINSINTLINYGINVQTMIMDAGYASMSNISEMMSAKIPFLTRMLKNRKEYKMLIDKYGDELLRPENRVRYGTRKFFSLRVPIDFGEHKVFAYIMHDKAQADLDGDEVFENAEEDKGVDEYQKALRNCGKFILISSNEYPTDEIVGVYSTRQSIEQLIDISKNYAGMIPLRGHSKNTILGIILISFIATAVYSYLGNKLRDTKISAHDAFVSLKYLRFIAYQNCKILNELTKDQNCIFKHLNIPIPFEVESGNLLHKKASILSALTQKKQGRGRPKGSKSKTDMYKAGEHTLQAPTKTDIVVGRRGRPKGSKNRPKYTSPGEESASKEQELPSEDTR
ncbi:MAG: transposase [Deltaproteobacteria bacterium]|jgi:hypothetical protein|nr:transposase [Deltaproteobacteria bacterium]